MTDSNPQNPLSDPTFIVTTLGMSAAALTTLYCLYQSKCKNNSNKDDISEDALHAFTAKGSRKNK